MTRLKAFIIAFGYAAPVVVLVCTVQLSRLGNVPLHQLLRDPLAVARSPFYLGAVSNLGIVCWSDAMGIALFVSCLRKTPPAARRFFSSFGILTLLLLMDDLYQVHEEAFPNYLGPGHVVVWTYGLLTALLLLGNRRFILSREYGHLVAALALFAVSLAFDGLNPNVPFATGVLIEDGAKLLGIVAWTIFTALAAR